jgi:hypothetical protein
MRHAVSRLALCGALLLCLYAVIPGQAYGQDTAEAQKVANQWLALVDSGKYGESWDQAAQSFKAAVSRAEWIRKVTAARKPLGALNSRKLTKSDLIKDPPNSPPGEYVGILYHSSFHNLNSAVETVVPMLDKDGKWRVSGYIVKKAG